MHSSLENLLERLIAGGVEFILVCGFAAVAHGASILTRDVDVCLHFTAQNLARLEGALTGLHPVHRLSPQREPLDVRAAAPEVWRNLYLRTDAGVLDCLGEIKGLGNYAAALPCSELRKYSFGACRILTLDALITAKEAMGRPHDLLTVVQLKALRERPAPEVLAAIEARFAALDSGNTTGSPRGDVKARILTPRK